MIKKTNLNICIAGLGTVGSSVIHTLLKNNEIINKKSNFLINILGISAKNKNKERNFDTNSFKWFDNPLDLTEIENCDVIIELMGEERGISFDLVKKALEKKN